MELVLGSSLREKKTNKGASEYTVKLCFDQFSKARTTYLFQELNGASKQFSWVTTELLS